MVNNPLLYAAIVILWLVPLPGFQNISSVSGIIDVMSLIMTAAPSLLILVSLEGIMKTQ